MDREHIEYSATVSAKMRASVESLFFFNPRQSLLIERIQETVEQTDVPIILENNDRVWIGLPAGTTQCLFACTGDSTPVGVALFSRPALDILWISHLAVDPAFNFGREGRYGVGLLLVDRIKEIARSIKGVTRIQLPYRPRHFLRLDRAEEFKRD